MFGTQALIEFAKSLAKFLAIGGICFALLEQQRRAVMDAMISDPALLPSLVLSMTVRLVSAVCVATIALVALDVFRARFQWRSDLRMTRQELKDELRQSDGDPLVKSRLRSLARDRARRRMIAQVPKATVVIANPTHYAIALKYDRKAGGAPLVLAKGTDLIALKIREVAARHSVPVVENRELARAMYDHVEVDKWIPPEFYKAVAKILFYLYSRGQHALG
jgi:flagellar biosynthetic protein FlhB